MKKILFGILLALTITSIMSAQSTAVNRVAFEVFMSTSNENPPVEGIDAGGTATVSFLLTGTVEQDCIDDDANGLDDNSGLACECEDLDEDGFDDVSGASCFLDLVDPSAIGEVVGAQVDFLVNYVFGVDQTVTGMHIHRAGRGENGPVVISSGISDTFTAAAGTGAIFRTVRLTSQANFDLVEEILANPAGFYLNIHTESSRSGLIRGQILSTPIAPVPTPQPTPEDPANLSEALSTIQATLNQIRVENAAQRETLARIASRLGIIAVDPGDITPEDLPEVEDCVDDDDNGIDDNNGGPCLGGGGTEDEDDNEN